VLTDDFQIASAISPTAASVWLIETTPDLPGVFEGFSGTLGWAIYAAAGSFPSTTPLAVGSDASPSLTDVGDDSGGHDVFRADLDLVGSLASGSLALGPGTYWFALHEGNYFSPDDGSEIRWLVSLDAVAGTRARIDFDETAPGSGWFDIGVDNDYAYRLTAVPEPASMTLLMLGAVAVGWRRWRAFGASRSQQVECKDPALS
jgi:hypothetical protein